ncbi:MAG: hypothetical protein CMJ88_10905 [Planctomycetes bacterium]|nr:hypothetical protein [Planctomycetota bacterium]
MALALRSSRTSAPLALQHVAQLGRHRPRPGRSPRVCLACCSRCARTCSNARAPSRLHCSCMCLRLRLHLRPRRCLAPIAGDAGAPLPNECRLCGSCPPLCRPLPALGARAAVALALSRGLRLGSLRLRSPE